MSVLLVLLSLVAADAPVSALPCDVVSVHDGDTLKVIVHVELLDIHTGPTSVRCASYDAWEINRVRQTIGFISDEEIEKGKKARDALVALLATGKLYLEPTADSDPHGRLEAELWLLKDDSWTRVSTWMKRHGHDRNVGDK